MTKSKKWIITIKPSSSIKSVVKEVEEKGFTVESVFEEIGSIYGDAEDNLINELEKSENIDDISPNIEIKIEPPDSGMTW